MKQVRQLIRDER